MSLAKTTRPVRLGTRGSLLATTQSNQFADQIRAAGVDVELVTIKTGGDQSQSSGQPLDAMGTTGVFTKEIQVALLNGEIDLTVHSLKDLPTEPTSGLHLACVPKREVAVDVLVTGDGTSFADLVAGSTIGTGSIRRQAQILNARPELRVAGIRGNVDTRLKKLHDGEYDAIVLAAAGLRRLGWQDRITEEFQTTVLIPAVGQGALGIETRSDDPATTEIVRALDHAETHAAVLAERALLAGLRGGCSAPIGAHATVSSGELTLTTVVLSRDGSQRLDDQRTGPAKSPEDLGRAAAAALLESGAEKLIRPEV